MTTLRSNLDPKSRKLHFMAKFEFFCINIANIVIKRALMGLVVGNKIKPLPFSTKSSSSQVLNSPISDKEVSIWHYGNIGWFTKSFVITTRKKLLTKRHDHFQIRSHLVYLKKIINHYYYSPIPNCRGWLNYWRGWYIF